MKTIKGNIYNHNSGSFIKGVLYFDERIIDFVPDDTISEDNYILPGLIDAHVHIESSMMSPIEYSRECVRHGVIAAITDPHEIANVCGILGVEFMVNCAKQVPVKIFTGAPSCVPATPFESSGAIITSSDIENLFKSDFCSHLSEMMNFPGVIFEDKEVLKKIEIANSFNKPIDGHAPMLSGDQLSKYVSFNITTDHECVTLSEAIEKIRSGMKIMLRESSASKDFDVLDTLIESFPDDIMYCTDDCHPDELQKGYIDKLVKKAIKKNYNIKNIINCASFNAISHYKLPVGNLKKNDLADFIVVDNLVDFTICKTYINGDVVFDGENVLFSIPPVDPINNFFINKIVKEDICVKSPKKGFLNVIEIIPDSLITNHLKIAIKNDASFLNPDIENDVLKIVVVNRYSIAKPVVGFIKGFGLKQGAIGGSVAHDSHNIIVVGVDDESILEAIKMIQNCKGGLVAISNNSKEVLRLPIAGLMSNKSCAEVAIEYHKINEKAKSLGTTLKAPFMTLAFMALLVIPKLKIGDKGLFNIDHLSFINLME